MKKLTLISAFAALAAASSAHAACNINGFYLGVGPSYNMMASKYNLTFFLTQAGTQEVHKSHLASDSASVMPYIGYGQKVVNDYTYLGLEATGNFGELHSKVSHMDIAGNGYYGEFKRKSAWGVGMRLGLLAKDSLFYTRLGVEAGNFSFRYLDKTVIGATVYPDWIKTVHKTRTAFAPAVGVETRVFHKKVALRGEFGVSMYSRWTNPRGHRPGILAADDQTYVAKFRPRISSFLIGAAYCF